MRRRKNRPRSGHFNYSLFIVSGREPMSGFCSTVKGVPEGVRGRPGSPRIWGVSLCRDSSPTLRAGRNALRVWVTALCGPAATLSIFLHSVACGGAGCRGTPLPLRGWVYSFVRSRRNTILFPALRCLRRNCAARARARGTPLPPSALGQKGDRHI